MTYNSKDMQDFTFFGILIGAILTFGFIGLAWHIHNSEFKREAVSKNCAEYIVDEYGRTTFQFKDYTDKKEGL